MAMLKFIFTLIVGVLLISHGYGFVPIVGNEAEFVPIVGREVCIGTCKDHPNCDEECMAANYFTGLCIPTAPPVPNKCCCVKTNHNSIS
ncbi:unnamed protein product [Lupinus luteus]|uniref:Uncharacterized protein n=1 Tax=Lupinus luteus TaxID=3873 RepID=A0AAV1WRM4_LUPLU